MNIVLIVAAGTGSRMSTTIPKQFLTIFDKPVIIYTLEKFENHPDVDVIAVVCLKGWDNLLNSYAKQYNITKLKYVISGGNTRQESIQKGLAELQKYYNENDIVLIHDGVRPNVSENIISECIKITKQKGNAITCIPCQDTMLEIFSEDSSNSSYPRNKLQRVQTPQGFKLKSIVNAYNKAIQKGIVNSTADCTLMTEIGETVYFSKGSETNIKLTTLEDLEIFKALLSKNKNQIFYKYLSDKE